MRAFKTVGPSKAEIQEVAEPEIGTGQVKVTVERAGICGSATEIGSGAEGIAVGDLVESTAVAWHAAKAGGVCKGSIVAIVGAGPVGLALILTSHDLGAEKIVVSEPSEAFKELAAQLGADLPFEASGAGAVTLKAAVAAVRNGGTIVMVASSHGEIPIDLNTIMNSQKRLMGTLAQKTGFRRGHHHRRRWHSGPQPLGLLHDLVG